MTLKNRKKEQNCQDFCHISRVVGNFSVKQELRLWEKGTSEKEEQDPKDVAPFRKVSEGADQRMQKNSMGSAEDPTGLGD